MMTLSRKHVTNIGADDRGMIMVMAIPMCLFLTGALWYIAGIGDAVLFRERMQEAADAVSFSTAVLEARGMNILVLLNLIMAAVEAILVALNLIMFATLAVAAILAVIGAALDVFGGAGTPLIAAAEELGMFYKNVEKPLHDDVVKPGVMDALSAIHDVESEIPQAVPPVAQAASLEIASFYKPTINPLLAAAGVFATGGPVATTKLPVKWGTTHKLCNKAFDAITSVMDQLVGGAGTLLTPVTALAKTVGASDYFCELDGGPAPDISGKLNSIGQSKCDSDQKLQNECKKASDEQASVNALQTKCGSWSADDPNAGPPPDPQCPNLSQLQTQASTDQTTCDNDKQTCQNGVKDGTNKAQNQINQQSSGGNSQGREPSAVDHANWWNGCDKAQIMAIEYGDGNSTNYSPKFVKIASRGKITMAGPDSTKGQTFSASQAEFFYDCSGSWDSCDNDQEAMWNFHWRARFRLTNPSIFNIGQVLNVLIEGRMAVQIVADTAAMSPKIWSSVSPARAQFALDLAKLTPPMSMSLH